MEVGRVGSRAEVVEPAPCPASAIANHPCRYGCNLACRYGCDLATARLD